MSMITLQYQLDMMPGAAPLQIDLSQYDTEFELVFHLYSRTGTLSIPAGATARIRGTKKDHTIYTADCQLSGNTVTVAGHQQITAAAGKATFELTIYNGEGKELNSANFYINVEKAAADKDSIRSDSVVRELVDVIDRTDEIIQAAEKFDTAAEQLREEFAQDVQEVQDAFEDATNAYEQKADEIAQVSQRADKNATNALTKATNAEADAADASTKVSSLQRQLELIGIKVDGKVDDAYVEDGYLYLTSEGSIVAGPLGPFSGGGGGGGGGNNAILTVTNTSGFLSKTIADGGTCPITFTWSSLEDDLPTGDGTVKVTVNGSQKASMNIAQGNITLDLAKYCTAGSNVCKVSVSDVYDNTRTITFSITVIAVSLASDFDDTQAYNGAISFPFVPVGSVDKTIHFIVDGKEIGTMQTGVSNRQLSYTIPAQTHGAHTIECFFECEVNGEKVFSNRLHYEVVCTEIGKSGIVIASSYSENAVAQYSTLNIPYVVYDPDNLTASVELAVDGKPAGTLTVDRTKQVWSVRVNEPGETTLTITAGTTEKEITLLVRESEIDVEADTDQLALYLTSEGRSNNEDAEKREKWQYESIQAELTGFNWRSNGWVLDDDGITVLRVNAGARVTIPYQIFGTDFRGTGKTIEVEFATRDVRDYDSIILSCFSGDRGLKLSSQAAMLKSEQAQIGMQYKENEHVRLSFVIEKRTGNRLVYVYVNGIMSGVKQYSTTDDFTQLSPVGISIGSDESTIDIYCIRVYDKDEPKQQVLENWIADTQDGAEMLERYQHNSVYDAYGNIVIANLPGDLPYMILEGAELPQSKGDKKTISVRYVDPVAPARSFTAEGVQIDVQGTSSQYYARKNYKMKYKKGFTMASGNHADTYALRGNAISIPVDVFCMKADVASSEGANNVELARLYNDACPYKTPAQEADSKVRQTIDGFPCVIFWNNGTETVFLGKYNFNSDKSTEETFGFKAGDESWEIKNNTSDRVVWKSDDYTGDDWLNDFEARYPDTEPAYTDNAQLAEFASWVVSTDPEKATDNDLPNSVTYGEITYTRDTADYRVAKFRDELPNWCEVDSALFYYLFTELFLMVDSRAKNAFPSFMGEEVVQNGN